MRRVFSPKSATNPDQRSGGSFASSSITRMGQSFEPVVEAARLGSEWAWAVIYREIAGPVTGFLRARGVADPEEAAGDVFFELSRTIERFSGDEESFRTLVFAIAYQRMIEDRHSGAPPRSRLADRVLDRIKRDVSMTDPVSDDAVTEEVYRAFELLTQEQRDVLSLRVAAGLSVEQTAEVIDRGIDTVRSVQRRAMAKLRHTSPGVVLAP